VSKLRTGNGDPAGTPPAPMLSQTASPVAAAQQVSPASPERPLPAVVINPSHVNDLPGLHTKIAKVCEELGWSPPLWLTTTVEDPGGGQTRIALDASADVVLACGGDGTVRHVARALAGSGTPLGLLPTGTANLLARNLALVLNNPVKATRMALTGTNRAIDVGRVLIDDRDEEEVFLVMAGMGFDAAIMAGAPHRLKARLGPLAYFVAGARALMAPRAPITLAVDGRSELPRQVRTVVVGNCGKLLAGLRLLPAAKVDDGLLDVVAIGPKTIRGWLAVAARVLGRRRHGHRIVQHWQGRIIILSAETPQQAQLDGDPVGEVLAMRMRVDPGVLLVRV
jgi:diacylglycerol kinase (ATP)